MLLAGSIMPHKDDTTTFLLRLPKDVLSWFEQEAARSLASRNSEIVRALRARMDAAEQLKKAG
jgi:hypothetical protein